MNALSGAPRLVKGAVARLLATLNGDGEETRVIGGAVRDALLGRTIGDIDLATTALPDEVIRRVTAAGFRPVPTGIDHGTVTVVVDGTPFEVTTLREDVETYGRKAKVAFGRDWKRDAERRDFTLNALSVSSDGSVHDYVGGLDDLAQRRVRFIGNAARRIEEDYLRILRFFRMHASFAEGEVDRAALGACISGRSGLSSLSAERVQAEFRKLLVAPGAVGALQLMGDAGLLLILLGGVTYHASFEGMVAVEGLLQAAPDPIRRLAALGVAIPEDADRLTTRLRLSNADARRLDSMGYRWRRWPTLDENSARVRLYKLGSERYRDRMMLGFARAVHDADPERIRQLVTLPEREPVPVFPLKAKDFIARGLSPGPALGDALTAAEQSWIDAGFPLDQASLDAIAVAASRATLRK